MKIVIKEYPLRQDLNLQPLGNVAMKKFEMVISILEKRLTLQYLQTEKCLSYLLDLDFGNFAISLFNALASSFI